MPLIITHAELLPHTRHPALPLERAQGHTPPAATPTPACPPACLAESYRVLHKFCWPAKRMQAYFMSLSSRYLWAGPGAIIGIGYTGSTRWQCDGEDGGERYSVGREICSGLGRQVGYLGMPKIMVYALEDTYGIYHDIHIKYIWWLDIYSDMNIYGEFP